jgi:hypothetical protein
MAASPRALRDLQHSFSDSSLHTPASTVRLLTGRRMPAMGFGTWQLKQHTSETVFQALEAGYRLIDTSGDYHTQRGIGEALRAFGCARDEFFVVTKIEETDDAYEATRRNLAELKLNHADLVLIHRPPPGGVGEVLWQDIRLQQVGTAPDGRPIYGPRPDGRSSSSSQDLMLTNTSEGESTIFTVEASKTWRTGAGRFDAYLGYGNQDVKDVNPGTSSTASSNWDNVAVSDPNDPGLETSNYEIEHRFNSSIHWTKALFGEYETSIALIGQRRSGRPYSYTFGAGSPVWGDPRQAARQRPLFYVPDGDVIFEGACSAAEVGVVAGCTDEGVFTSNNAAAAQFAADMDAYIEEEGLEKWRGRIMPRNSHRSPWVTSLDLRFAQELPIFRKTRGIVTFDIENFTNLLNSDWGQLRQVNFPFFTPVADANRIETAGCPDGAASCYAYRPRSGTTGPVRPFNAISSLPSIWRMQLGFRIEF